MLKNTLIAGFALLTAACMPIPFEPRDTTPQMSGRSDSCAPDNMTLQIGQSAADSASVELPGYIDILRVESSLVDNTLTAVFYLRDIPQDLIIGREGVSTMHQDYGWFVDIDVDGIVKDVHTNYDLFDYTLRAENLADSSLSDSLPSTRSFEDALKPMLMEFEHDSEKDQFSANHLEGDVRLHVSHVDSTLTLSGHIPGISHESTLLFWTFDMLSGQDGIACPSG